MKKRTPEAFASILVARFLCERRPMPGVSGTTGYLYHVPTMLKDFIYHCIEDPIPQQVHYKTATGVGNRSLLIFTLPNYLWGFTEDLSGALSGPMMDPCKESVIYKQSDFTRPEDLRTSRIALRLERQFEPFRYIIRRTESQEWLESLGFDTLAGMLVMHRKEFEEWIKMVVLTRARCKPVSSEEMAAIESLIGSGTWQRVIPVRVLE